MADTLKDDRVSRVPASHESASPISAAETSLAIGEGWHAELAKAPDGAVLRIGKSFDAPGMEITIRITPDGPVLRARAARLELEAERDLVARCERFRVEATQSVSLVSAGEIQAQGRTVTVAATHGCARVQANDDVQLLGENVLLNCDRPAPAVPTWALHAPTVPPPSVPVQDRSGDFTLPSGNDEEA